MKATLHTSAGDIVLELMESDAPKTVANFVKLIQSGFYDGTAFHRIISGFMIQGGDPLTKDDSMTARWGTGGPGYTIEDELRENNRNEPYTISMANTGQPHTGGCQFFINVADNDFLDDKHTVFGRVIRGQEVVDTLAEVATGEQDRPLETVRLIKATID